MQLPGPSLSTAFFFLSALIPLLSISANPAPHVDSKAIKDRFSSITAEDMEMLRGKKIFLVSRSFGLNTHKGLTALAKEDKKYDFLSSYHRFDCSKTGGDTSIIPADVFSTTRLVHLMATHYPFTKRIDEFEQALRQESQALGNNTDAAILFFDNMTQPQFFDHYSARMEALRTDFPKVKFIFATAGFCGPSKAKENELGHEFSEKVRERYLGKAPLYDMGKILSDDFRVGHVYCPEYSNDPADIHPNLPAGEAMLAKGLLLILRDTFRSENGNVAPAATPAIPVISNTQAEALPANHPDALAVRALLDANGLEKKTIEGVSVIEGGRIVGLYLQECGITTLPAEIGKLDALRMLWLYGDRKQSYPLLRKIAPEIGRCTNLEEIQLAQNDLENLPVEITQLPKVKLLTIGDNRLKNLPADVFAWVKRLDPKGLDSQIP